MAYSKNAPFRADVVGSYLRPDELKRLAQIMLQAPSMPLG